MKIRIPLTSGVLGLSADENLGPETLDDDYPDAEDAWMCLAFDAIEELGESPVVEIDTVTKTARVVVMKEVPA